MTDATDAILDDGEEGHTAEAAHDLMLVRAVEAQIKALQAACRTACPNYRATRQALHKMADALDDCHHDELAPLVGNLEWAVDQKPDQPGGNRPWRYGTNYRPRYSPIREDER